MKIVYCLLSTFNSGGMERVICQKSNYLVNNLGYEIHIITTDQKSRPAFFNFSEKIIFHDLGINYDDDNNKPFFKKMMFYLKKKKKHKRLLAEKLFEIRPDITISTFGNEAPFLCNIKDGSKKIIEIHFSKYFRMQYDRKGLWRLVDILRTKEDARIIKQYNTFVTLTKEDKNNWDVKSNIVVIPNPISFKVVQHATLENKKVLAVGRYAYQKGFDLLINSWQIVNQYEPSWSLEIVGDGELKSQLQTQIQRSGLEKNIILKQATNNIEKEYLTSSIYVLSSRYEGLPLVLLEAMSCGIPIVSFGCKAGPRDIISHEKDGLIVEAQNCELLAHALLRLIRDKEERKVMGANALIKSQNYNIENIMKLWENLFLTIIKGN